jgi:hypothetical protein
MTTISAQPIKIPLSCGDMSGILEKSINAALDQYNNNPNKVNVVNQFDILCSHQCMSDLKKSDTPRLVRDLHANMIIENRKKVGHVGFVKIESRFPSNQSSK